jgi:hypothetical protein
MKTDIEILEGPELDLPIKIEIFDFIPLKILWDTGEIFSVGFCYYDSGRNLVIPVGDTAPVWPVVDRKILFWGLRVLGIFQNGILAQNLPTLAEFRKSGKLPRKSFGQESAKFALPRQNEPKLQFLKICQ